MPLEISLDGKLLTLEKIILMEMHGKMETPTKLILYMDTLKMKTHLGEVHLVEVENRRFLLRKYTKIKNLYGLLK